MEENILDILSKVDETVCWDDCLDEIQNGMKNYQTAPDRGEDPESCLTPVLPAYWNAFHAHNIYQRQQGKLPRQEGDNNLLACYDVAIFLVGFSTLPIVLSLAEINPTEEVYFLYSKETIDMLNEISNRISVMCPKSSLSCLVARSVNNPNYALEIQSSSDPVQTFKRIKEVIDKVGDKRTALDLTGGKKTMLGGGFTGGAILGLANTIRSSDCDMFYVDCLEYDPSKRAPTYGTEFLNLLENPYNVYNVQSVQQAEKLFEKHNYEAAAILLEGVVKHLSKYAGSYGLQKEQEAVNKNLYMADCYGLWDAFDYIAAKHSKEDNGDLWDYNAKHTLPAAPIDILGILSEVEGPQTLFAEKARIVHYAVDRHQNGIRRMKSDRFDDAIVRFTQVIEILCRYHVYQIAETGGLTDNSHDPVSEQCCLEEEWSIRKLIRFLFGIYQDYDGYYQIAHPDERLDINEYDGYNHPNDIIDLIKPRNDFVHVNSNPGWEEMREDAENLQKLAKTFLENFSSSYCCNKGLSFNELLELHKFRQ